jgi:hypothetical protein
MTLGGASSAFMQSIPCLTQAALLAVVDSAFCFREFLIPAQTVHGAIRRRCGRQVCRGGDARPAGGALVRHLTRGGIDGCIAQPETGRLAGYREEADMIALVLRRVPE